MINLTIAFLMDPLESIHYEKDTTLALMVESAERGHRVVYIPNNGMGLQQDKIVFHAHSVKPAWNPENPFGARTPLFLTEDEIDVLFIRTDPPFNEHYLINTWLLDRINGPMFVINNPTGIRTVNEKLWCTQFRDLIPPTRVTSFKKEFIPFLHHHTDIVLKPIQGYGGQAVFRLKHEDSNAMVAFETLTRNEKERVILQRYIPEAEKGDKRILLLNGDILGGLLRVHSPGEHRNNFFSGGKPYPCEMSKRDQEIVSVLKPHLKALGLYFVGIDIIGNYLTEINVTSPTCLREMNTLYETHLEKQILDFVEQKIRV